MPKLKELEKSKLSQRIKSPAADKFTTKHKMQCSMFKYFEKTKTINHINQR